MARTVDARLVFLVDFARVHLSELSDLGWTRWRARIGHFLGPLPGADDGRPYGQFFGSVSTPVEAWTNETVRELQLIVSRLLEGTVGRRIQRARDGGPRRHLAEPVEQGGNVPRGRRRKAGRAWVVEGENWRMLNWAVKVGVSDGEPPTLNVSGEPVAVVTALAQLVLWLARETPVQRCMECDAFFVASRIDSKCCSTRCTKKRWWKTPRGKKALKRVYRANGWRLGARKNARRRVTTGSQKRRAGENRRP